MLSFKNVFYLLQIAGLRVCFNHQVYILLNKSYPVYFVFGDDLAVIYPRYCSCAFFTHVVIGLSDELQTLGNDRKRKASC